MSLFSQASPLLIVGIVVFALVLIAILVWLIVLSRQVSKLARTFALEQIEHFEDYSQFSEPDEFVPLNAGQMHEPEYMPVSPQDHRVAPAEPQPQRTGGGRKMQPQNTSSYDTVQAQIAEANAARPAKNRKGRPNIPFGQNKEAQARATRVYTDQADDSLYDPDSIDFTRVEGLKNKLSSIPASAQGRTGMPSSGSPRQRDSRPLRSGSSSGRIPSENARQATAETRASFNRMSQDLQARLPHRESLSERRQSEQIRRQAASIRQSL